MRPDSEINSGIVQGFSGRGAYGICQSLWPALPRTSIKQRESVNGTSQRPTASDGAVTIGVEARQRTRYRPYPPTLLQGPPRNPVERPLDRIRVLSQGDRTGGKGPALASSTGFERRLVGRGGTTKPPTGQGSATRTSSSAEGLHDGGVRGQGAREESQQPRRRVQDWAPHTREAISVARGSFLGVSSLGRKSMVPQESQGAVMPESWYCLPPPLSHSDVPSSPTMTSRLPPLYVRRAGTHKHIQALSVCAGRSRDEACTNKQPEIRKCGGDGLNSFTLKREEITPCYTCMWVLAIEMKNVSDKSLHRVEP
ncbi:hypothetical protein WN55_06857 [Dufourea novaeangliae]|uniref:Uncharacterized protein n=1 Tax=Dufourea novaeangliae TaxID=178035 RepID=A0A154P405_DUFNO|nr:hypothetical protein WN55_06857 [Dufourea novaeangliae]